MDDLGIRLLPQPIVGVDYGFAMPEFAMFLDWRDRRLGRGWSLSRQRHERNDASGEPDTAEAARACSIANSPKLPLSHSMRGALV